MSKKILKISQVYEFSSIFRQSKWLSGIEISIYNFNSKYPQKNQKILDLTDEFLKDIRELKDE